MEIFAARVPMLSKLSPQQSAALMIPFQTLIHLNATHVIILEQYLPLPGTYPRALYLFNNFP